VIKGVEIHPLRQIPDERGKVMHMLRRDDPWFSEFGEIYFSVVFPGAIKAWHLHTRMTLNYAVPSGRIKLVLYDDRDGSPTRGELQEIFTGEDSYALITVPPGVWNGFKGIGGRFDRRKKLFFAVEMPGEMRFTRLDTGRAVQTATNLKHIPASPRLPELMASCLSDTATAAETAEFRQLWQARVRSILLEHGDDPDVFLVTPV